MAATFALLKFTCFGSRVRALGNDPDLAVALGIRKEAVVIAVFVLATILVGIAAIFQAHDTGLMPSMGFRPLMMGIVAYVIGGVDSILGVVIGGLIIGAAENASVIWLSSQWQDAIVFAIFILFLLLRPQGILGKPLRTVSV